MEARYLRYTVKEFNRIIEYYIGTPKIYKYCYENSKEFKNFIDNINDSRKKKIKSICCFMMPFLVLSIYLIYNDAFYQFIDYCFLGMIDFGETNKLIYPLNFSLFIVNVVVILYWLFKSEGKDT